MELELRARVPDRHQLEERLGRLEGIAPKKLNDRQVDTYLKHHLDVSRRLIFRIRRHEDRAVFTLKMKSLGSRDILWQDIDLPVDEPDRLEDILTNSGYEYVVLIDKTRDSFAYHGFEINIDQIRDLGTFIEVEAILTSESEAVEKEQALKQLLRELGIGDEELIEQGYVQLMEQAATAVSLQEP